MELRALRDEVRRLEQQISEFPNHNLSHCLDPDGLMTATVTARGPLKVVAVLHAAELLDIAVPDGKPRFVLTIRLPDGVVTADLAAKSVRRTVALVREHGPEEVAAIVQGRLSGNQIAEAGLSVRPKVAKPEKAEAVAV